jgi:uncharacterized protein YkwD
MNGRLGRAASGHSHDMVRNGYFQHESRDGRAVLDRIKAAGYMRRDSLFTVGENIGWGSGTLAVPRALMQA